MNHSLRRALGRTQGAPADAVEEPIYAEIFGIERLEKHAESLAKAQEIAQAGAPSVSLRRALRGNAAQLRSAFDVLVGVIRQGRPVTPAAEWLVDNYYLVDEHIQAVRRDLPVGYYKQLPKLANGHLRGYPRIYGMAWALIAHSDNRFDLADMTRFCDAYQRVQTLTIGELWALPITLRVMLIENLTRHAAGIVRRLRLRNDADALAELLLSPEPARVKTGVEALRALEGRALRPAFDAQLMHRLKDQDPHAMPALQTLHERLALLGTTADDIVQLELQRQGSVNVSVRNIITSLRRISQVDWSKFFEGVSHVDALLRDQSRFAGFDFATRDLYRHAIEDLARHSPHTELEVARIALELSARAGRDGAAQHAHWSEPGQYLIGAGRPAMESAVDYRVPWRERAARSTRALGLPGYWGSIAALSIGMVLVASWLVTVPGSGIWARAAILIATAVAASDIAIAVVNLWVTRVCVPQIVPGLALLDGVPAELRTVIAVPVLLTSAEEAGDCVKALEVHYLSSRDGDLRFALLSDWLDSPEETAPGDDETLATAATRIAELNVKYGSVGGDERFLLFHRKRSWNAGQGRWMGWERKRGKLHEFNRLLLGEAGTSFIAIAGAAPRPPERVRYVITVDADGRLLRDTVVSLVGKMAHPLNAPIVATGERRVVAGYGLLQPRITASLPVMRETSAYQRISAGPGGIDPYAFAVSDVYQDLFGEGSFSGKGIYDLAAFEATLAGRVGENRLLSHDLFEGTFARCGLATDVEMVEDPPARYDLARMRQHRWTRGDWQLLPFVVDRGNAMPPLGRWKMIDNLRRSLVPPATVAAFGACWWSDASPLWTVLLAGAVVLPLLLPFWVGLRLDLADLGRRSYLSGIARDARQMFAAALLKCVFLADQAWMLGDAIVRTLYRLTVSHRNLLQWTSFAQSRAGAKSGLPAAYRLMAGGVGMTLAVAAALALSSHGMPPEALPWLVAWLAAPLVAERVSRARTAETPRRLTPAHIELLRTMARDTWRFFETQVTAAHHMLPPDNFQETPRPVVATRTSPTNIGLYLLSVASAVEFGWIDRSEALDRWEATFATLGKLERFRGHFFNWYDTQDLRALEPKYLSTVDSGNLAGHLLTLAGYCRRLAAKDSASGSRTRANDASPAGRPIGNDRLEHLARRAQTMALDMSFGFLLDPDRELLAIGYRDADRTLDSNCYDLLASEARLASFLAIAKGDVPVRHWFRLGRSLAAVDRSSALISWSGSMFEYLMPILVMREPEGSVLGETARMVVKRQIDYGRERGLPWGVSESAFNARDPEFTYQYSSFGIPGLGLQRGLGDEAVVAPYATALAAMIDPQGALENFELLQSLGARGALGWYDALDFSPARVPEGAAVAVVQTYMAHHQGMVLTALTNILYEQVFRSCFHAHPLVQATELLLQEKVPRDAFPTPFASKVPAAPQLKELAGFAPRRFSSAQSVWPRTHVLSNGSYAVMITAAGSGYSRWRNIALTRWREDPTLDAWGSYIFLRDVGTGRIWSSAHQPLGEEPDSYDVTFFEDRVTIGRRDGQVVTSTEILVTSEDDLEVRRLSVTNEGRQALELEMTTYAEVVLATADADDAHPAFSKLFVQTEYLPDSGALLATRRRRDPADAQMWLAHWCVVEGYSLGGLQFETDRARFIGRGRTLRTADAIVGATPLTNTVGTVLDPVFSLRRRVRIEPGASAHVAFWTGLSATRAQALTQIDRHRDKTAFDRARTMAWTEAQVQRRHLGIDVEQAQCFQRIAGHILYANGALRAGREVLERNRLGPASLWAHGISGDLPIVLVRIDAADDLAIVRQLLVAFAYWQRKRVAVDVVILNDRPPSYASELQQALDAALRILRSDHDGDTTRRGAVFLLRADLLDPTVVDLLQAAARVMFVAARGSLTEQTARLRDMPLPPRPAVVRAGDEAAAGGTAAAGGAGVAGGGADRGARDAAPDEPDLEYFNGLGGFSDDGREYVVRLEGDQWTPVPWTNVLANERFGCLVTCDGNGTTWSLNAQQNQLTPWSNDPVSNAPSDVIYVRDDDGALWTPTPLPIRQRDVVYTITHGFGYSRFRQLSHGIDLELLQFVPRGESAKVLQLTVVNRTPRTRGLTVTHYVEWVLGNRRSRSAPFVVTGVGPSGELLARNPWSLDFRERTAFMDMRGRQRAASGDRAECIGRHGSLSEPLGLSSGVELSNAVGGGFDPCGALQTRLTLAPGESTTLILVLGEEADEAAACAAVARLRNLDVAQALASVTDFWRRTLGGVQVRTPDRTMDLLVNGWLLYQTLACRVWARTGFYQSSGAYGFRDQLQDVMALCRAAPAVAREHILRASGRQFAAGDVQHWWLPSTGQGIQTRVSDDRIWLPYVVAHYLEITEDFPVLNERAAYLAGEPLAPGHDESFFTPVPAGSADLLTHCVLALDSSLKIGSHGLPLFGTGDWNDGMNRVGSEGRGESVWLGWFLYATIMRFAPIAERFGRAEAAARWRRHAFALRQAIEREAWDGDWYRRGYFDDGSPLGSVFSNECRIDSIAQSWAVISEAGDTARSIRAMAAVNAQLVSRSDALLPLFTPAFDHSVQDPGYVKAYPPGIRENGGQYTHGALWSVIAFALLGDGDRAAELFALINPINHSNNSRSMHRYQVEPYVVCADVYSNPLHTGRGGWTWYTGSASWMYRTAVDHILGIQVRGDRLAIDPVIPHGWRRFEVRCEHGDSPYEIVVENPSGVNRGVIRATVDGGLVAHSPCEIPLIDDGKPHVVLVTMGAGGDPMPRPAADAREPHFADAAGDGE